MRSIVAVGLSMLVLATSSAAVCAVEANGGGEALDEAKAALLAEPPRREIARAALARATAADSDPSAVAEAYMRLGSLDEDEGAFARAVADYRASTSAAPTSRWAHRASLRIAWLEPRAERDFAPLGELLRLGRDPALAGDSAAIEALSRRAESLAPGPLRAEMRMFVAEACLRRLGRPEDAKRGLLAVIGDPSSDPSSRRVALRDVVLELLAEGRLDDAAREVHAHPGEVEGDVDTELRRLTRRRALRSAAFVGLAAIAAALVVWIVRARRRA